MSVEYLGYLRGITGKEIEESRLPERSKLEVLLTKLAEAYGDRFKAEVFDPHKPDIKTGFVVTVNGILSEQLRGLSTRLNDGDRVVMMSLMSGG